VRLLVLGGTRFVGRGLVDAALAGGHEVTLFHRGRTGDGLYPEAEHLLGDRDGGLAPLAGRAFDACVDVSGYVPRVVRASAELLRETVPRYVFVSSISAYASMSEPTDEDAPLAALDDEATEDVSVAYGGLKALCERVVAEVFGAGAAIARPTFVVGPGDYTGRFTWWVHRAARGGDMLVPASNAWRMQLIDMRDLGRFLLQLAAEPEHTGAFNVVGPEVEVGLVDLVEEAAELAGVRVRPVVVDDAFLVEHGVTGAELPLWIPDPGWAAWAQASGVRAREAGIVHTPVVETLHATLDRAPAIDGVGLAPEREAELLEAWAEGRTGPAPTAR
jgi:2'-hydroxyisoflavone reductase